jgi:hypothetical protein
MSTENVVPFPRAVRGRPPIIAIAPSKTNGISFAILRFRGYDDDHPARMRDGIRSLADADRLARLLAKSSGARYGFRDDPNEPGVA